jgi:16S rRNA (guanine527-N7)-methyltransferase
MTAPDRAAVAAAMIGVLEEARRRGFLGPGPAAGHVHHAWPLVAALPPAGRIVDLGAGGGVPGLVLAVAIPGTEWALVESQQRRAAWLLEAVAVLQLGDRVDVRLERAEVTGRGPERGRADAVVARGFAAPAVTAECAAPLLAPGATCWVSEPPVPVASRWPVDGLALLGLTAGTAVGGWMPLTATSPCPDRYPRRVGVPAKRPLF